MRAKPSLQKTPKELFGLIRKMNTFMMLWERINTTLIISKRLREIYCKVNKMIGINILFSNNSECKHFHFPNQKADKRQSTTLRSLFVRLFVCF